MRDVNGSSFTLLLNQADWPQTIGMSWVGTAHTLAGRQSWRLPAALSRADAQARLAASRPVVVDGFGGIARISQDGSTVESLDGASWVKLTDQDGTALAPQAGRFVAMALGGARLALISSNGAASALELFDLRGRWPLHSAANPALPLSLDPAGTAVAVAEDGPIFVLVQGGLAIIEGGPILTFVLPPPAAFAPLAANPAPLRQTALLASRPGGAPLAMATGPGQVAILLDQGAAAQTLALLDRTTGAWSSTPLVATDATPLPYFTDVALLADGLVALMAPNPQPDQPADCAVVSLVPPQGVSLAAFRYPMLNQYAPRFVATPGPAASYLGGAAPDAPVPRPLLPLPYPAYRTAGVLGRFALPGGNPDLVWHRLYAEAYLPHGTGLAFWARAADSAIAAADQQALLALLLAAPAGLARLGPAEAASLGTVAASLSAALGAAPFHRQPPLTASPLASELPFHPGLSAQDGMPGGLYELLLQRTNGQNRRLTGALFDIAVIATGDGRHSPCLRAVRLYTPRFCYQDEYLPVLFHQTALADEADPAPAASPPDFRERLLADLEGMLTPIETRVAAAEYMLDPYAAPAAMLPWLASYLGCDLDPGWPEARTRRRLAMCGRLYRQRGTYRGVCLALDIATDGAVQRGEVVVLETHRLRRIDATVLGIAMGGRNVLTADAVASGNSIVGDTLILSAERATDVLALLAPGAVPPGDAAAVAQFLDEYADRVQIAAILQGPAAATLQTAVKTVLDAELPAQLAYDIILAPRRFILGLSPLLDVDTFLDPPAAAAPLTLNRSVIGQDAVVRDPAALRQ